MPFGITVPMVASGTRSPACMLKAPHPISSGSPSPASTITWWILLAPSTARVSSTRATTMPSSPSPIRSSSSTAMPRSLISSPSATGSPSNGAKSRSQESRTFMDDLRTGAARDARRGAWGAEAPPEPPTRERPAPPDASSQ